MKGLAGLLAAQALLARPSTSQQQGIRDNARAAGVGAALAAAGGTRHSPPPANRRPPPSPPSPSLRVPPQQVAQADGEVIITNDGATILNKMKVEQPAAKMLVDLAKSQVGAALRVGAGRRVLVSRCWLRGGREAAGIGGTQRTVPAGPATGLPPFCCRDTSAPAHLLCPPPHPPTPPHTHIHTTRACPQDVVAGDGTTSVTVMCGALLRKSLELLERGVHPTVISDAFGRAADKAVEVRRACLQQLPFGSWGGGGGGG